MANNQVSPMYTPLINIDEAEQELHNYFAGKKSSTHNSALAKHSSRVRVEGTLEKRGNWVTCLELWFRVGNRQGEQ